MKIIKVGDHKTNLGFMLAGVSESIPDTIEKKDLALKLKDPELGLAIFTTSTYQKYAEGDSVPFHTESPRL